MLEFTLTHISRTAAPRLVPSGMTNISCYDVAFSGPITQTELATLLLTPEPVQVVPPSRSPSDGACHRHDQVAAMSKEVCGPVHWFGQTCVTSRDIFLGSARCGRFLENSVASFPQERFLALVSAETLLVGHALENDLRVLRCLHGRIVDTAILYPHPKARVAGPGGRRTLLVTQSAAPIGAYITGWAHVRHVCGRPVRVTSAGGGRAGVWRPGSRP